VLLCSSSHEIKTDKPLRQSLGGPTPVAPLKGPWKIQVVGNALDEVSSPGPGGTVVELPAFRHRAREFRRHPGWEQPDYNDSAWEQVYAVGDGTLFVHPSPVLLRGVLPPGAKAIETPLPVTGEYVLYVNGVELEKRLGPVPQPGRIDISHAVTGIGDVIAIETTSHGGPAGLRSPLRVICGPVKVKELQPWSKWNLPWYSGRILYRTQLQVPEPERAERWSIDLGNVQHYAEVWLNGKLVGTLLWPPYRIELPEREAENDLVLIVSNSVANRFAWDLWGTRGGCKPEPSGILGPVRLLTNQGKRE
jgi:hypothetical protein